MGGGAFPCWVPTSSPRVRSRRCLSLRAFVIVCRKEDCGAQPAPSLRGCTPTPGSTMEEGLGSWNQRWTTKPKIPLAKAGGCPGHQGLGRSLGGGKSVRREVRKTICGDARMTSAPHMHLHPALGRRWGNIRGVFLCSAKGGHRSGTADWKALVAPRCKAQRRMLPGILPSLASSCCLSHTVLSALAPTSPRPAEAAAEPGSA